MSGTTPPGMPRTWFRSFQRRQARRRKTRRTLTITEKRYDEATGRWTWPDGTPAARKRRSER